YKTCKYDGSGLKPVVADLQNSIVFCTHPGCSAQNSPGRSRRYERLLIKQKCSVKNPNKTAAKNLYALDMDGIFWAVFDQISDAKSKN
ncbi:MAG: hypothetical protein ABJP89_05715, partial [Lentilitoribacter sp.]